MGPNEDGAKRVKHSFWTTLPGVLAAVGTAVGAAATLVTAIYSAGAVVPAKPEANPPAAVTQAPTAQPNLELEGVKKQVEDLLRQKLSAEEARAKAETQAVRALREQAATAKELVAARKRAEDLEAARVKAEAEAEQFRRELAAVTAKLQQASIRLGNGSRGDSKTGQPPFRDAIGRPRVAEMRGNEVWIDVGYSFDRSHRGPILIGGTLLYQGRPLSEAKLSPVAEEKGTARIQLTVTSARVRQSDELEIVLFNGKERLTLQRFPFARRFDSAREGAVVDPVSRGYR